MEETKLKDGIKKLPPDMYIKIGCTDGSGYIYDGMVKDLDFDVLESIFDSKDKAKIMLTESKKSSQKAHDYLGRVYDLLNEAMKEAKEKKALCIEIPMITAAGLKKNIITGRKQISQAKNFGEKYEKWTPIRERPIKEVFWADWRIENVDAPVKVIKIPGTCSRNCWWVGDKGGTASDDEE